jgi:general stress protein YciG
MKEHEKMTKEEAGHKGGIARTEKYSKEELSEQAKKSADTIEQKHPGFHSEIGQKGGKSHGHKQMYDDISNLEENE